MAFRTQVTAELAVKYLNELIALDRLAMERRVDGWVPCNQALADRRECQVAAYNGDPEIITPQPVYGVGTLGVLNGLFGISDKSGFGAIAAVFDTFSGTNRLIRFELSQQYKDGPCEGLPFTADRYIEELTFKQHDDVWEVVVTKRIEAGTSSPRTSASRCIACVRRTALSAISARLTRSSSCGRNRRRRWYGRERRQTYSKTRGRGYITRSRVVWYGARWITRAAGGTTWEPTATTELRWDVRMRNR